jgi:uncharacterized protein (DUF433 family)
MTLPDFLTEDHYGEICLTGHRIGLYHLILDYREGFSPEKLHEEFPTLPLDLIHKVLTFYRENQAEVDAYVARCQREIDRQRAATPRAIQWDELRRRFEALAREGKK